MAIVKIIPLNPISLEKFSDYPDQLDRFIIGDTGCSSQNNISIH
jgi:hypothetical protein